MDLVRCISCDGYGWYEDDDSMEPSDCTWCKGVGYVYRLDDVDHPIPPEDYGKVADQLETLERERLRELGYQGQAKRPWEQEVRHGTKGGINPYDDSDDDTLD